MVHHLVGGIKEEERPLFFLGVDGSDGGVS